MNPTPPPDDAIAGRDTQTQSATSARPDSPAISPNTPDAAAALSTDQIAAGTDAYPTGDAALRLLGPRLAAALNRATSATGWQFAVRDQDGRWPEDEHRLLGPAGQTVTVGAYYPTEDAWRRGDPWRIRFESALTNGQPGPVATTAADRTPAAIAAHLRRRLLPGYERALAVHAAAATREHQGREAARQSADTIAAALGSGADLKPGSGSSDPSSAQILTWQPPGVDHDAPAARLVIPPGAKRLRIEITGLDAEAAIAVGTALNTHYQQRSDSSADDRGPTQATEPAFAPPSPHPTGRPETHRTGRRR